MFSGGRAGVTTLTVPPLQFDHQVKIAAPKLWGGLQHPPPPTLVPIMGKESSAGKESNASKESNTGRALLGPEGFIC